MKFEVGKKYRTRMGSRVTLVADISPYSTYKYNVLVFLRPEGDLVFTDHFGNVFPSTTNSDDVIQEWGEPLKKTVYSRISLKGNFVFPIRYQYSCDINWDDFTHEWNGKKVRVTIEEVEE